jgi:hypothetical protein
MPATCLYPTSPGRLRIDAVLRFSAVENPKHVV